MAAGLDGETLDFTLESISEFARRELPDSLLIELDERDEFPEELVRRMCGEELGVQLLFIPEEFGGMGGGASDVYRVCERMATIDLGVATSVLATFLGSDPITVGGTEEQKQRWMTRIADEGILMAYGATEPDAGSDLASLKTTAKPVSDNGRVSAYRITGAKQWISNGGVAELATVLALAPGGPSWFVVESGAEGFTHGDPEDKHGIRLSNTAALFLEDALVDADALVGGAEGEGLTQAQQVFGFTRLMVAAFGLGAGWAALDRAVPYSQERIQAGGPLSEKQGNTHKLIVPHAVRLEAARAAIEETADRIDMGGGRAQHRRRDLEVPGQRRGGRRIVFGIASIVIGATGRADVSDKLEAESITGTPDMTPQAIAKAADEAGLQNVELPTCSVADEVVDTGEEAKCFAEYMRIHSLEATGGKTYAQMPRFATADGEGTNDAAEAQKRPDGSPMDNPARSIWVTETALGTALNVSFFAQQVALFSIVMGVALLLTGIGFLVLTLGARSRARAEDESPVERSAAVGA